MPTLYSILDIESNVSFERLEEAYNKKVLNSRLGVSDYENIYELLESKKAYKILSNKAFLYLYDIKHRIPKEQRFNFDLKSNELDSFLETIEGVLIQLSKQNREHLKQSHSFKEQSLLKDLEIDNLKSELKKETEKCYDMEETISGLLSKIELLNLESTSNIELQSKLNSKIEELKSKIKPLEKENKILHQKIGRFRIYTFKIVTAVTAFFLFVIFMMFGNR